MLGGLKHTLCTPGPRNPTETEPQLCLSISCGSIISSGPPQGQGLWVWNKPSQKRLPLTHHRATRTRTGLGKQTLRGHKQNLVRTRTQKKGAVASQETDPQLPRSVQESPAEAWVGSGLLQGRGTECSSACMGPFERGHHYLQSLW